MIEKEIKMRLFEVGYSMTFLDTLNHSELVDLYNEAVFEGRI